MCTSSFMENKARDPAITGRTHWAFVKSCHLKFPAIPVWKVTKRILQERRSKMYLKTKNFSRKHIFHNLSQQSKLLKFCRNFSIEKTDSVCISCTLCTHIEIRCGVNNVAFSLKSRLKAKSWKVIVTIVICLL